MRWRPESTSGPHPARTERPFGLREVAAEPGEDAVPAVHGGLGAVSGPCDIEERVPGALVGVELVRLALVLQLLLELGHLLRRRVLIVRAEQAEQRAGQVLDEVLDGPGLQRHALWRAPDHERAVAVHGRVERQADRGQHRLAPAGAVADHADLAVGVTEA